jgi:hypothetical protein
MRWKTNRPEPKPGEERKVWRFAWLPIEVGDQTVWLERYGVIQRRMAGFEGDYWVDFDAYLLEWMH